MRVIVRHQDRGALRLDHVHDQALCEPAGRGDHIDHPHNAENEGVAYARRYAQACIIFQFSRARLRRSSNCQSPSERAVSVPKALVWPAFLVYDALKALHR
jgi:hypothetical protein